MTSHDLSPDLTTTPTPTYPPAAQSSQRHHHSAITVSPSPLSPSHRLSGSRTQPASSAAFSSTGSAATQPAMAMTAPAMSQSSSFPGIGAGETSSFDLPPMPVPYEDFHFSLDLPENVHASDLSLLQNQTDFHGLFGTSSAMHTPSIVSGSALFGSATPLVRTPAPLVSQEPQPPHAEAESSSMGAAGQLGSEDAVMTSMQLDTPASSASSSSTLRAGPPPPPDFEPPPGHDGGAFSFNSLLGGQGGPGGASFDQSHYPGQHLQQMQQQQQYPGMASAPMASGPAYHPHPQALKGNFGSSVQPLFEPSESDFLSNFLEGFESSWNFNPTLPDNMPSFAAAAQQAGGNGYLGPLAKTPPPAALDGTLGNFSTPRGPNGNSNGNRRKSTAKKNPLSPSHDGPSVQLQRGASAADSSFAAFGGHLNEMEDEEEDELDGGATSLGTKRSSFARIKAGGPKRRGSLAHLDGGNATSGGHLVWPANAGMQAPDANSRGPPPLLSHQTQPPMLHLQRVPPALSSSSSSIKARGSFQKQESPTSDSGGDTSTPSKDQLGSRRDLLTDKEKRQNHIMSEQRRRNHIREGFAELVSLLDLGRSYGARGLGLSSGAGTGIEDEGLDDRTDVSSDEESDEEAAALAKARRKKARAKRNALLAAAAAGGNGAAAAAAARGRGKGRGRGGSAGGGAGSKSAVLFQAVDLVKWLESRNESIEEECRLLEEEAGMGAGPVVEEGATAGAASGATKVVAAA